MLTVFTFIGGFTLGSVCGVVCMGLCSNIDNKDDDYIEWKD